MDSEIWLCVGKVLGTPRHPSVDGYLPHVFLCVFDQSSKNVWLIIKYKYPNVVGRTSIGDASIQHGQFCWWSNGRVYLKP